MLLLFNVCWIGVPLPAEAPVTVPGSLTVQAYVVAPVFDVRTILICVLLHIVSGDGVAVTTGIGFTVMI